MERRDRFEALGRLFGYPVAGYVEKVEVCRRAWADHPEVAGPLAAFAEGIRSRPSETLEEAYTATFDLAPACALEIGWHLFGECYERGEFLVKVRQALARHGVAESVELPDHLSQVLALFPRLPAEEAGAFATACLLPALEKMTANLSGKGNLFEPLLHAVARALGGEMPPQPRADAREEPAAIARNGRAI